MQSGDMVRAEGSAPMKLRSIGPDGTAECLLIDHEGVLQRRFYYVGHLKPMWQALQPRTCWTEVRHVDVIEFEKEERDAAESRRRDRRAARKSKQSKKIKRKTPVAA